MLKWMFFISLFIPSLSHSKSILSCQFGMFGAPIIQSQTELVTPEKIGAVSRVNYTGSPAKEVPNLAQPLGQTELFRFQLDEGMAENNLLIVVFRNADSQGQHPAIIENPQSPSYKKMKGLCAIN